MMKMICRMKFNIDPLKGTLKRSEGRNESTKKVACMKKEMHNTSFVLNFLRVLQPEIFKYNKNIAQYIMKTKQK